MTEAELLTKISSNFVENTTPVLEETTKGIARYTFSGIREDDGGRTTWRTFQYYVDTVNDVAYWGQKEDMKDQVKAFIADKIATDVVDTAEMIRFDETWKIGFVRSTHIVANNVTYKYWQVFLDKNDALQAKEIPVDTYLTHLK